MNDVSTAALVSFAEFERLEAGAGKTQLLTGELIRLPPTYREQMILCERLYEALKAGVERLRKRDLAANPGNVHIEMGYRFQGDPASWLQPDVSVTHPNQPFDRFYLGAPLIAFELATDFHMAEQLDGEIFAYLANGAAEVWVLYPTSRHAWVFYPSARQETRAIHTPLLPSIEIPLDDILQPPVAN